MPETDAGPASVGAHIVGFPRLRKGRRVQSSLTKNRCNEKIRRGAELFIYGGVQHTMTRFPARYARIAGIGFASAAFLWALAFTAVDARTRVDGEPVISDRQMKDAATAAEFIFPDAPDGVDPMVHTRRMLGLDAINTETGRTRLKLIDGTAHVLVGDPLLLG